MTSAVIFDLDGTLIDSDKALVDAFVRCGIPADEVTFGHVLHHECDRLGISVDDYIAAYNPADAKPFDGVGALLAAVPRWAIASHKDKHVGLAELASLGWQPEYAFFTQDFGGTKELTMVLTALGLRPEDVVYVGDTAHDRHAAQAAGVRYIVAGWNPRADVATGDVVAATPGDVLRLIG